MRTMNRIIKSACMALLLLSAPATRAQQGHQPDLDFALGSLVSANPDSVFKIRANAFIGDSMEVTSIRVVVTDSTYTLFDQQYALSSLPAEASAGAWKEDHTIHVDVPDYNPFRRRHYLLELLGLNGQLLLQIEKEF